MVGTASPEHAFVGLQMFAFDAAKNHRAQPAIADVQRLSPFDGRLNQSVRGVGMIAGSTAGPLLPTPAAGQ